MFGDALKMVFCEERISNIIDSADFKTKEIIEALVSQFERY